MSIRRGFRPRTTGGIFPINVRVFINSVIVETPKSYHNTGALSPNEARRLAAALADAAHAIDGRA